MKKFKLLFVVSLISLGLIGGGAYLYFQQDKNKIVYSTETVRFGDIESVVLTNGVLYPKKIVNVGAQVSGKLESIAVNLGDKLKQGDLIAQIDNLGQKNALKEAQASLNDINAQYRAKQAQITQAKLTFEREKKMLAKKVSSISSFDQAKAELDVYQAQLEQLVAAKEKALINVDNAKLDLGYTTISSPIEGTVVYVSVEEGQTVNTNQSTPSIIEVAQLNIMTVKAQISEADIINVKPEQKVYFSILGAPEQKFYGKLRSIEPGPTLLTGSDSKLSIGDNDAIYYNALFDIENKNEQLRFGMTAQVSIVLDSANKALLIPSQVLTKKIAGENRYQVSVLKDGKEDRREVEIGINNKVYAEVLSGLVEGEQIILAQTDKNKAKDVKMPPNLGANSPNGRRS